MLVWYTNYRLRWATGYVRIAWTISDPQSTHSSGRLGPAATFPNRKEKRDPLRKDPSLDMQPSYKYVATNCPEPMMLVALARVRPCRKPQGQMAHEIEAEPVHAVLCRPAQYHVHHVALHHVPLRGRVVPHMAVPVFDMFGGRGRLMGNQRATTSLKILQASNKRGDPRKGRMKT